MQLPTRDGNGYFAGMNDWTAETAWAVAEADGVEPDEDQNGMFKMWRSGPMKPITRYDGLAKSNGCV
jgi:tRNA 2-thiouridine synthesizing protein E